MDEFKRKIQNHLEQRAANDSMFAICYTDAAKNMDDCITYIVNAVEKEKRVSFTNREIYAMAVRYFEEPDIEVGKPKSCTIKGDFSDNDNLDDNDTEN